MDIYVDTSVFGGYYDDEFSEWTRKLFYEFEIGSHNAIISDLTIQELEQAPEIVFGLLEKIPERYRENIFVDDEVIDLAHHYIRENVVSENFYNDALHIALATRYRSDVLVSWNFRHIVNLNKIRLYNAVNLKQGYQMIEIRSPREVLHEK